MSDSISLSLEGLEKKEKLKALAKLANTNDLPSIERLEKEANKQNNHLRLAQAHHLKHVYYQFVDANDSLSIHYGQLAAEELEIARKGFEQFDENELRSYQSIKKNITYATVKVYLTQNKYELALIYLNGLLEDNKYEKHNSLEYDSYALLGMCYMYAKKPEQGFEAFKKAYEVYEEYAKPQEPYEYCRFFEGMSYALQKLKDHKQMIILQDSLENMIVREHERTKDESFSYHIGRFMTRNYSAYALIKQGDLRLARKKLNEARKIILEDCAGTAFTCNYYEVEIQYYLAIKDYNKAKEYLNLYLECVSSKNEFQGILHYIDANLIKAEVLHKSGENKEAYELLSELYQLNDSISTINYSNQLAEIQTLHKVDRMKIESDRDKQSLKATRTALIGAILISLLLLCIIYIVLKNDKLLKAKNKQLYNQFVDIENKRNKIKELESKHIEKDLPEEQASPEDPYSSIMKTLEEYMVNTEAYKDPDITRENLSLAVGTNRQYLIEAIKEKTGMTFNEYIYSFRIKYAYNLMVSDKSKKISDVCIESGFLSRGTFNRAFKETFGMSPSELRDFLN